MSSSSSSKVNPKTTYTYHLKKAAEPILLVTLVSSLALNLAVFNTQQQSESKLHDNRLRLLNQLNLEASQALSPSRRDKKDGNLLSNLPSVEFHQRELLLAKRLQHLGIQPEKVSIHPRILEELKRDTTSNHGPKSVAWSEALFGNPDKAKSGMRKAVAGIRDSMTMGIKRSQESIQSESEAKQREREGKNEKEDWTDQDWELAFLKAAESSESSNEETPSITSLLRSDLGSHPSSTSTSTSTPSNSSSVFSSSWEGENLPSSLPTSSRNLSSVSENISSTSTFGFGSYEPESESAEPQKPRSSPFTQQQNQGARRYF